MMSRKNAILFAGGLVLAAAATACAPGVTWVTPTGTPIKGSDCLMKGSPTPESSNVCRAKQIRNTASDIAQCRAEGGYDMLYTMLSPDIYSCNYPAADDGKPCKTSEDCEIACDADSFTCRAFSGLGSTIDRDGYVVETVE